jgi:transposase InsO family protein
MRKAIIELRQKSRDPLGAKKVAVRLAQQFPGETLPSKATIYNVLRREGLTEPRKKRQRVSPYPQPFSPVHEANTLWSIDFKGQFRLGNGEWCYPLTVMDHHSRYLLACRGGTGTDAAQAQRHLIHLFREYGLPERIGSDNGVPFATRGTGGLSSLSIWWIRLGIVPERIKPGKPQQNGRHERMHRTLKAATARPAAASFRAQQRRFDEFRQTYKHERPHEGLEQTPLASHYSTSPRTYPEKLPEPRYPGYFEAKPVSSNGVVYFQNGQVYVSHLLTGELVGLEEVGDGIWDIYFGPVRLGGFDLRDKKGGKTPYWTIKV